MISPQNIATLTVDSKKFHNNNFQQYHLIDTNFFKFYYYCSNKEGCSNNGKSCSNYSE